MNLLRTKSYLKAYRKLDRRDQMRIDKAISLLVENPYHPSLNIEKVSFIIWSIRASDKLRMTFRYSGELNNLKDGDLELRNVGPHQTVYRSP